MSYSFFSHLECSRCQALYEGEKLQGTCACGAPLLARYDLPALRAHTSTHDIAQRPPSLWRYHELLPVMSEGSVVTFGEGMTPLLQLPRLGAKIGIPGLMVKDESILPTGTFKARGAATGVSRARELGAQAIAMPTNGNAGAAWAAYAARAGLDVHIVMPEDSPHITKVECSASGADLYTVDGLINDAGQIVAKAVAEHGWMDTSTLKEPYRVEGKKTMGLEIAEQLGWRLPDVIIYPTGGGVGIIGIYKALREALTLGWVDGPLPRLVAVQATGCAPIVAAFETGRSTAEPWEDAHTVAFGITVPKAIGDFLVLEAVHDTGGCATAVEDDAMIAGVRDAARLEGIFMCPEGGATVAAARQLRATGWIGEEDRVVLLNTGSGIKYPDVVSVTAPCLPRDGKTGAL